jgi:uncharacterized glyoxalase superfamily protein PhnB
VKVKRIVSNVPASDVEKRVPSTKTFLVSVMSEGGSGTAVPDISIEVDDLEDALTRVQKAGVAVEYGPKNEPWGVCRFYVRDPFGKLINILQHG